MDFSNIISVISMLGGIAVFYEWRIRSMSAVLEDKIQSRNKINEVIQEELKSDIARLESKIDMLIQLQIRKAINDKADR